MLSYLLVHPGAVWSWKVTSSLPCNYKIHLQLFSTLIQTPPGVTESQNHRMFRVGRDLCGSSSPTLLPKQGHLQQAAEDFVQAGLQYLQRRRLYNLPGQPGPGLHHPQREEVLPHVQTERPTILQSTECFLEGAENLLSPLAQRSGSRNTSVHLHIHRRVFGRIPGIHIQVGGSRQAALALFLPGNLFCNTKVTSTL